VFVDLREHAFGGEVDHHGGFSLCLSDGLLHEPCYRRVGNFGTSGPIAIEPEAGFRFSHALCRRPGASVARGLRTSDGGDPDPAVFSTEHAAYVHALRGAGLNVTVLDPLEAFPDSVFIEDVALTIAGVAIILRPGAKSRFGEREQTRTALACRFETIIDLDGDGFVDGGDILVTGHEVLAGLSSRTDERGVDALGRLLAEFRIPLRRVNTPPTVLHFKTGCALLDAGAVFCHAALAATGCFSGYRVIECPGGEEPAANLIRVNDVVLLAKGYPKTAEVLASEGFTVEIVPTAQAAMLDGGLSCMSLRW